MTTSKLKEFLDTKMVKYVCIMHSPAYTAQEIAHCSLVSGNELAKTVILKVDGEMVMAVLPAAAMIDMRRLRQWFKCDDIRLAREHEFFARFPECDVGAMPALGNLYGMDVYIDPHLTNNRKITFNAGTQDELISMMYKDYKMLVEPTEVSFCYLSPNIAA